MRRFQIIFFFLSMSNFERKNSLCNDCLLNEISHRGLLGGGGVSQIAAFNLSNPDDMIDFSLQ